VAACVALLRARDSRKEKKMEAPRSFRGRRYEVDEKINAGSFGVILRVKDCETGEPLVAKVFEEEEWVTLSDDEEETTMSPTALREISFMQLLERNQAPHMARMLDFDFSLADYMALVVFMPLYCGDLSDALSEERLDCRQRCEVGRDVLKALAYLHSSSPPIAHRDIKPENVLLDAKDRGALADFGFACFIDAYRERHPPPKRKPGHRSRDSSTSQSCPSHSGLIGTVTYIAPEVIKGAYPHQSADLWATGVMFLEMYDNERLDADTDKQAFKRVRKRRKTFDDAFLIQRILKSLLREKPLKRSTAASILDSLNEVHLLDSEELRCEGPRFEKPTEGFVSPQVEALCQRLKAVVPDTVFAAEQYCRISPDMDPRSLAIIAAKVHEHLPMSDESMVHALDLDVETLENAQEEMLKRTGGCLLLQSLFGRNKLAQDVKAKHTRSITSAGAPSPR
jgi:serine/threonine protein kinase